MAATSGGVVTPRHSLTSSVRMSATVLSGPDHFTCYLAWPLWTELTDADRADLANIVTTAQVPAPDGAPTSLAPMPARSPVERWWNALALSVMRKRMTRDVGALVVVGGRVSGQQGLYPGVIEEASLALAADVPLFVAGGFGGCGRLLARVFDGEQPAELSIDLPASTHQVVCRTP